MKAETKKPLEGEEKQSRRGRRPGIRNRPKKESQSAYRPGQPRGHRVTFTWEGEIGKNVFVAGSFNNWDATAKQLIDKDGTGHYSCLCLLQPGRHEYKFVVEGEWLLDAGNPQVIDTPLGTQNNWLEIEK